MIKSTRVRRGSGRFPTSRLRAAAALVGIGAVVAACGSSPTDSAGGSGSGSSSGATDFASVLAAVQGLSGQERQDKLVQMAKDAGGQIGFYHAGNLASEVKAFTKATGIKVNDFQATAERVAEKITQEKQAGQQASDVYIGNISDAITLGKQGALADLNSPALKGVPDNLKGDSWVSPYLLMEMPSYNTDAISKDQLPKSWEDLFAHPPGRMGIEITDWDWYETLIRKYFMAQKGMSEQDAINLVNRGFRGATQVDGHTLVANLLASGQFDYAPNAFSHYFKDLQAAGAPITWDGLAPDMPPVATPLAMGLTEGDPNPAGGLALFEWLLSKDGQQAIFDTGYTPTSTAFEGDTLLKDYPATLINNLAVTDSPDDIAGWKAKFDALLKSIGGTAVSK